VTAMPDTDDSEARALRAAAFDQRWDPDALNEDPDDEPSDPSARVAAGTWSDSQEIEVTAPPKSCTACGALINPLTYACRC
jgi:hypothetical protein